MRLPSGRRRRPASRCRCPAWPGPTPDRGRGPRMGPKRRKACNCGTCSISWCWPTRAPSTAAGRMLLGTRRADAGLGWLTTSPETLPAALEAMVTGGFEPEVWIPAAHPAAHDGAISLAELVSLPVIHGLRRAEPVTYDAWTTVMQTVNPRFAFIDPPLRCPLPATLAFAATGNRPTAVLTSPATAVGGPPGSARRPGPAETSGMVRVSLPRHSLTASAALVWHRDPPRGQCRWRRCIAGARKGPCHPAALTPLHGHWRQRWRRALLTPWVARARAG